MPTCGDFLGALQSILSNDINPLVTTNAVLVFPPFALVAVLLAAPVQPDVLPPVSLVAPASPD